MSDHPHPTSPFTRPILEDIPVAGSSIPPAPVAPQPPAAPHQPSPIDALWTNVALRYSILGGFLLCATIAAFLFLRPLPKPDYARDPMDDVLAYTLLSDEFNNLPVDKRLELLHELIERLRVMSADDSSMMAAFAASIDTDKLRRQLEENASRLALDVWDKYALDYHSKPAEQRAEYLDETFLNMTKMMETVAGVQSNKTDAERLAEAKKQAARDRDALTKGEGPTAGQLARVADLMRNRVGRHSSPQQQQRGMQLMRDMTRHLRDQDPVTGK